MKVLFIGGTGNISAACADEMHRRGAEVWILTRGNRPVPKWAKSIIADRKDAASMRAALDGKSFDVAANFLGFQVSDVRIDYECLNGKVGQYIFISSATVYAKPHKLLPITEKAKLGNPYSEYAREKEKCESWLMARMSKSKFPVTIIRPSHTYSNGWIPNPVKSEGFTFAARLLKGEPVFIHDGGKTPWTLTASSDFARGFAGLAGLQSAIGQDFHITSDEVLTWAEIYDEIIKAFNVISPKIIPISSDLICLLVPELTPKLLGDKSEPGIFDNSKIKKYVPDFKCEILFRDGIKDSAKWFEDDRSRCAIDKDANEIFDKVHKAWLRRTVF